MIKPFKTQSGEEGSPKSMKSHSGEEGHPKLFAIVFCYCDLIVAIVIYAHV